MKRFFASLHLTPTRLEHAKLRQPQEILFKNQDLLCTAIYI